MDQILQFIQNNSGVLNIILAMIVIFQWFDRRSKGKWLENSLFAMKEMSERLESLDSKEAIKQKSSDSISVINAAIKTLDSKFTKFSFKKPKFLSRNKKLKN